MGWAKQLYIYATKPNNCQPNFIGSRNLYRYAYCSKLRNGQCNNNRNCQSRPNSNCQPNYYLHWSKRYFNGQLSCCWRHLQLVLERIAFRHGSKFVRFTHHHHHLYR